MLYIVQEKRQHKEIPKMKIFFSQRKSEIKCMLFKINAFFNLHIEKKLLGKSSWGGRDHRS